MAKAFWKKYELQFHRPSGTSRGVLHSKTSYFIVAQNETFEYPAIGECSLIKGLSPDPLGNYESTLQAVCDYLNHAVDALPDLKPFPSIRFGLEMFLADVAAKGSKVLLPSAFTERNVGMRINGLIWMGQPTSMLQQIAEKITLGFTCIKLKIGALDFETEIGLLQNIRKVYGDELELRVDANGAFDPSTALEKLEQLSRFKIHSIEQPIAAGQWEEMGELCKTSPIPIALDEELIGVEGTANRNQMLANIKPQYIITKPSLLGGFSSTDEWITLAEQNNIGWWMTSALESNVGLNAIAQYTYRKNVTLPQGLGTGGLYTNNLDSPLYLHGQYIHFDQHRNWDLQSLQL